MVWFDVETQEIDGRWGKQAEPAERHRTHSAKKEGYIASFTDHHHLPKNVVATHSNGIDQLGNCRAICCGSSTVLLPKYGGYCKGFSLCG